jgi:uncharacterized protein YecT (DUF1311 family)
MTRSQTLFQILFLPAFLLSQSAPAQRASGQAEKPHPIDEWLDTKMETSLSTAAMRQTLATARGKWDAEMNRVYKRLMAKLKPSQRAALQSSQRKWLAFRDAEFAATREITGKMDGTLWLVRGDEQRMNLVRDRANQLLEYDSLGKGP